MYAIKIYFKKIRKMDEKKIDGVIVMLEALGAYMADPCYNALFVITFLVFLWFICS